MKKKVLWCCIVLFYAFGLSAQSIELCCARVNEDGSATLFFQTQTAGAFVRYEISVFNPASGNYDLIGTESNTTATEYTDNATNAANASVQYKLSAITTSGAAVESDIRTLFLTITENQNATVTLAWNDLLAEPPHGSEGKEYKIYRKRTTDETDWNFISSTSEIYYVDTLPRICEDTILYKVELENDNACLSRSNQVKIEVVDSEIPSAPILQSSSVDVETQKLNLHWLPSSSVDVYGYVICAGSPCVAIDTVWGADAANYVCEQCNVEELNSLAVMAFDTCFNTSLRTDTHTNIVLNRQRKDCSDRVLLSWNEYQDFDNGVEKYNIYYKNATSHAYTLLQSTLNTEEEVQIDLSLGNCSFYVAAVSNNGITANSNAVTLDISVSRQVDFIEIRRVSIRENNTEADLEFYVDASLPVEAYRLQRSIDGGNRVIVAELAYTGQNTLTYTDKLPSSAAEHLFCYTLSAPDECGLTYKFSETVCPMRLSLDCSDLDKNVLSWTPYTGWQNPVERYDIFRFSYSEPLPIMINSTSANSYTDTSHELAFSVSENGYFVQAIEQGTGADGKQQTANSNSAFTKHESLVFMPNAFTPKGAENNIFKPECRFVLQGSYLFRIFNRQAALLFQTDDPSSGWNGKFKGEFCHPGTYIYILEFVNDQGEKIVKRGTFAIVE